MLAAGAADRRRPPLPPPTAQGQYDRSIPRFFLVLHDVGAASEAAKEGRTPVPDPRHAFEALRGTHGASACYILHTNSLPAPDGEAQQPDVWSEFLERELSADALTPASTAARNFDPTRRRSATDSPTLPGLALRQRNMGGHAVAQARQRAMGRALGSHLHGDDVMALRSFTASFIHKGVLPELQRRMATLDATIASARKGIRNALKSFWRKPKAAADRAHRGAVLYPYDSIEAQIRTLADLAFVIRDYDHAVSLYRMAKEDFKSDKVRPRGSGRRGGGEGGRWRREGAPAPRPPGACSSLPLRCVLRPGHTTGAPARWWACASTSEAPRGGT